MEYTFENIEQSNSSDSGHDNEIDSPCSELSGTSPDNDAIHYCTPMTPDAEPFVDDTKFNIL